jgi:glycosyltransferase involved in cell wall biosynthesis
LKNIKSKILAIIQLPPPVHGQSTMNQVVYESKLINQSFNFKTIQLHFATLANIGIPSINKLSKMIFYLFHIFNDLRLFKPDLIYFTLSPTGLAFYRDSIYVGLIRLFRVPIVFHLHGKGIKEKARHPFNKILYFFVFKNAKIILLSKLLKTDLEGVIDKKKQLFYLPNGIKDDEISHHFRQLQKPPSKTPVILFLSNIDKTKGVFIFLEALSYLIKRNFEIEALLVGGIVASVPEKMLHQKINDYNLTNNVTYLGPKFGKEKEEILSNSDIFVFPTYKDAFPLVILEAMRAGLPILSTKEGAIPEIVDDGKTGLLVEKKNARDLADKIELLLKDDKLRSKMGKESQLKFLEKYSSDIFEKNLNNIFKKILREF